MPLYFTNLNSSTNSLASKKPASRVIVSKSHPPPKISDVYVPATGLQKRNPIRHYRRSLTNTNKIASSSNSREVFNQFGQPGKTVIKSHNDNICDCPQFSQKVYPNSSKSCSTLETCHLPIKSASTNIDKKYSTTMRELMERRGRTYRQNLPSDHSKVGLSVGCPENPVNPIKNNNTPYSCNINSGTGAKSNSEYQHSLFYRSTNGTVVFIHNDKCVSCNDPIQILNKKHMNMTPKACNKCLNRTANNNSKNKTVC